MKRSIADLDADGGACGEQDNPDNFAGTWPSTVRIIPATACGGRWLPRDGKRVASISTHGMWAPIHNDQEQVIKAWCFSSPKMVSFYMLNRCCSFLKLLNDSSYNTVAVTP